MSAPFIQLHGGQQGQHGHPGVQGGNQGRMDPTNFPAPPMGPQGGHQGRPVMPQQGPPGGHHPNQAGFGHQIGHDQPRLLQSVARQGGGRFRFKQEVHDIHSRPRSNEEAAERLSSHVVISMTKADSHERDEYGNAKLPSWDKAVLTEESEFTEQEIVSKIRYLNSNTEPVLDKKVALTSAKSSQLDYVKERLDYEEDDQEYEFKLVQFETLRKKMPLSPVPDHRYIETSKRGNYHGRGRSRDRHRSKNRPKNKVYFVEPHRSNKHKHKGKKHTVSITAYFKRTPKNLERAMEMFDERERFGSAQRPRSMMGQNGIPGGQPPLNRGNHPQGLDPHFQQGQMQRPQGQQGQFAQQGFPQQGGHPSGHPGGQPGFPQHGNQPGGLPGHAQGPQGHPQGPHGGGMLHQGQQNMMNNPNLQHQQRPQMNQAQQRQGPPGPHLQQQQQRHPQPQHPQQQGVMRPPPPPNHGKPLKAAQVVQTAGKKKPKNYHKRGSSPSSRGSADLSDSEGGYFTPDTSDSEGGRRKPKKRSRSRDRRGRGGRPEHYGVVRRHHEKFGPEPILPPLLRPPTPPSPNGRLYRERHQPPRILQEVRRGRGDREEAARFRHGLEDLEDDFQGMAINERQMHRGRPYESHDYDYGLVYPARRPYRPERASEDGGYNRAHPRYRRNVDDFYPYWRGATPRRWDNDRLNEFMRERPRSLPDDHYEPWSEIDYRGRNRPGGGGFRG